MASLGPLLVIARSATALIVVSTVALVLFRVFVSNASPEATLALLWRIVPAATDEATVTWTVKAWLAPAVRPVARRQVTSWPDGLVQATDEPATWNVVPLGRVSLTVKPPVLSDGPVFVTVRV